MLFRPNASSFTNPMTTTGDMIYSSDNSGTAARLPKGTDGQVIVYAGGVPTTGNAAPAFNYIAKSATYNPAAINDYIFCTGASFTITLPDATTAGYAGKMIAIHHAGTNFSQVYTLATTGGQTIGGVASGSWALYTAGEVVYLMSIGTTDWQVVQHKTSTIESDYSGSITTQGFGTPTITTAVWTRIGSRMRIYVKFTCGTNTGVEARIGLAGGSTVSTALNSLTIVGHHCFNVNNGSFLVNHGLSGDSFLTFGAQSSGGAGLTKYNGNGVANSTVISLWAEVPITGWQP